MILPDQVLLQRYVQGDASAFTLLVERHGGMVVATCRRICGSTTAEDAAQDVFAALATRAGSIRDSLAGWLYTAAVRTAWRWREREHRHQPLADEAMIPDADDDQVLQVHHRAQAVDQALGELSAQDRDLLVRHFLEGATQQVLAEEAGISQPTMHRRIQQAVERLRKRLPNGDLTVLPVLGSLGPSALSPTFITATGKIALAGAPAATGLGAVAILVVSALAALLVVAAGVGAWLAESGKPAAVPAVEEPLGTPAPMVPPDNEQGEDPLGPALAQPISLASADLTTALGVIERRLEAHGFDLQLVNLASRVPLHQTYERQPLRAILDDWSDRHGLRWHYSPGVVTIDYPLPPPEFEALLAAVDAAPDDDCVEAVYAAAYASDAMILRELLIRLGSASAQRADAILYALGDVWYWNYFHTEAQAPIDDGVRAALRQRWQRTPDAELHVLDVALMGMAGIEAAAPRLHRLLADPAPAVASVVPAMRDLRAGQVQVAAALSLALLGDERAGAAILEQLGPLAGGRDIRRIPGYFAALAAIPRADPDAHIPAQAAEKAILAAASIPGSEYSVTGAALLACISCRPDLVLEFIQRRIAATDPGLAWDLMRSALDPHPELIAAYARAIIAGDEHYGRGLQALVQVMARMPTDEARAVLDELDALAVAADEANRRARVRSIAAAIIGDEQAWRSLAAETDLSEPEQVALLTGLQWQPQQVPAWRERLPEHLRERLPTDAPMKAAEDPQPEPVRWWESHRALSDQLAAWLQMEPSQVPWIPNPGPLSRLQKTPGAQTLIGVLLQGDPAHRRAAAESAAWWFAELGPWSPALIQALQQASDDEDRQVARSARQALRRFEAYIAGREGWASAAWGAAMRGAYDDPAVLAAVAEALVTEPEPVAPPTPAEELPEF